MRKKILIILILINIHTFIGCNSEKHDNNQLLGGELYSNQTLIRDTDKHVFLLPLISNEKINSIDIDYIDGENLEDLVINYEITLVTNHKGFYYYDLVLNIVGELYNTEIPYVQINSIHFIINESKKTYNIKQLKIINYRNYEYGNDIIYHGSAITIPNFNDHYALEIKFENDLKIIDFIFTNDLKLKSIEKEGKEIEKDFIIKNQNNLLNLKYDIILDYNNYSIIVSDLIIIYEDCESGEKKWSTTYGFFSINELSNEDFYNYVKGK